MDTLLGGVCSPCRGFHCAKMNFLELSAAGPHPADLEVELTVKGQPWKISEHSCLKSSW